uniref:Uncharacterized protein n=1 Tax=Xiphophorus couchianus TaxID=32473 RepID=A0A3B5MR41_9TELE
PIIVYFIFSNYALLTGTELSVLQLSAVSNACVRVCVSGEEWVGGCKRGHPDCCLSAK